MGGAGLPRATTTEPPVIVQPFGAHDVDAGARILFEAFDELYDYHRFPGGYPNKEFCAELLSGLLANGSIWGAAARSGDLMVGSAFLDERDPIRGIGPVSVDPGTQAHGVGRRLMQALLERAAEAPGTRLLQDSFNRASLALYVSLGFEASEQVVLLAGRTRSPAPPDVEVRALDREDIEECERLCVAVHGFERTNELRDALADPLCDPLVALRDGQVVAYATTLGYFPGAHGVATSAQDMRALILGGCASSGRPVSFLLPTHQGDLLRWCLSERLRIVKPMTYMTIGEYRRPTGCWIPSLMY
jgi:GNAT superfamily N-acetyltransferase